MAGEKKNERKDKPIFSWESPEFVSGKKNKVWFVGVGLIALALAYILYRYGQISGALVVLAGAFALIVMAGVHPKAIKCELYPDGIVVDGRAYRFDQLKSFWFSGREIIKVKLQLVGRWPGEVVLPLKDIDAEKIRAYLKKHLPEGERRSENLAETINRWMRL